MYGIKVAAAVVGGTLAITALVVLLVFGLSSWLGWVGGVIAYAVLMAGMFVVIAVVENQ